MLGLGKLKTSGVGIAVAVFLLLLLSEWSVAGEPASPELASTLSGLEELELKSGVNEVEFYGNGDLNESFPSSDNESFHLKGNITKYNGDSFFSFGNPFDIYVAYVLNWLVVPMETQIRRAGTYIYRSDLSNSISEIPGDNDQPTRGTVHFFSGYIDSVKSTVIITAEKVGKDFHASRMKVTLYALIAVNGLPLFRSYASATSKLKYCVPDTAMLALLGMPILHKINMVDLKNTSKIPRDCSGFSNRYDYE
jgi:hypothetical protein